MNLGGQALLNASTQYAYKLYECTYTCVYTYSVKLVSFRCHYLQQNNIYCKCYQIKVVYTYKHCVQVWQLGIPLVKLQVWSFHKWYPCTTAQQYRTLTTNSGMPSFLVGTQDIGPHEVSYCLIHVPILSPLPFYTIPIFFLIS